MLYDCLTHTNVSVFHITIWHFNYVLFFFSIHAEDWTKSWTNIPVHYISNISKTKTNRYILTIRLPIINWKWMLGNSKRHTGNICICHYSNNSQLRNCMYATLASDVLSKTFRVESTIAVSFRFFFSSHTHFNHNFGVAKRCNKIECLCALVSYYIPTYIGRKREKKNNLEHANFMNNLLFEPFFTVFFFTGCLMPQCLFQFKK